jgi:predicted unusual protein kinase regulating ubiquinone biosynthesis (AarF/ABC1/UbiB family)
MNTFSRVIKTGNFIWDVNVKYKTVPVAQRGPWLQKRIEQMGPTYVKLGQFMASRPDVLGDDKVLVSTLKNLQDSVDPLPWDTVKGIIDASGFARDFEYIQQIPLASASIGQVHMATLLNGKQVVIKLKRPGVAEEIAMDMDVIETYLGILALLVGANNPKVLDSKRVVCDIKNMILKETDFINEVVNMELMYNTAPKAQARVPRAYKRLCGKNTIVMEYIPSVKLTAKGNGASAKSAVAYALMDLFIQQFLQHGVLHGDPHEGNVALGSDAGDGEVPSFVLYDFGHIVQLDSKLRSLMKMLVFEIMIENVDGVVDVLKKMPDIIEIRDESTVRSYISKYIEYVKSIDVKVLKSIAVDSESMPIKFSNTIFEIVRVFGIIEGICLELDPTFEYEKVFIKYMDTLILDADFIEYKIKSDISRLFTFFQ